MGSFSDVGWVVSSVRAHIMGCFVPIHMGVGVGGGFNSNAFALFVSIGHIGRNVRRAGMVFTQRVGF